MTDSLNISDLESDSYLQSINPGEDGCLCSRSLSPPPSLVLCSEVSRGHAPEGQKAGKCYINIKIMGVFLGAEQL